MRLKRKRVWEEVVIQLGEEGREQESKVREREELGGGRQRQQEQEEVTREKEEKEEEEEEVARGGAVIGSTRVR